MAVEPLRNDTGHVDVFIGGRRVRLRLHGATLPGLQPLGNYAILVAAGRLRPGALRRRPGAQDAALSGKIFPHGFRPGQNRFHIPAAT